MKVTATDKFDLNKINENSEENIAIFSILRAKFCGIYNQSPTSKQDMSDQIGSVKFYQPEPNEYFKM